MEHRVYRYALDIMTEDRTLLGQAAVEPDWAPVVEWASFQGIRRGELQARMGSHPGVVEPIWDAARGEPYVSGFRAVIPGENGGSVSTDISTSYFRPLAHEASTTFVEKGLLKGGDLFRFRVCAFEAPLAQSRGDGSNELVVEEIVRPLPLGDKPLAALVDDASVGNGADGTSDDVPVVIPQDLVEETMALCREAPDIEVGGVLLGKLQRDPGTGAIFVEVTAQISAAHTLSGVAKLTFTPETWSAVDTAIKLRREDEIKLGWWHYHPDWCRNCPPEKRRDCNSSNAFFSSQDVTLHRVCFSSAYHIAALICNNSSASELGWYLFGWREGQVVARAFHVMGDAGAGVGGTTTGVSGASTGVGGATTGVAGISLGVDDTGAGGVGAASGREPGVEG